MYLKQSKSHGRTYLSIVEAYRIDKKARQKTIKKLGYLEDLKNNMKILLLTLKK